jgi:hypothetical protein
MTLNWQCRSSRLRAGRLAVPRRRQWLQVSAVALSGFEPLKGARATAAAGLAPVRSCIFIFYQGGPSHLDTWDMKPRAPVEVRGPFASMPTAIPGVWAGEHLPRLARVADRLTIVRSLHHRMTNHLPAAFATLIGRDPPRVDQLFVGQGMADPPSLGSAVSHARPAESPGVPPFVALPYRMWNEMDVPGQSAGFLGASYEPLQLETDPNQPGFRVAELDLAAGVSEERLDKRLNLLALLDRHASSSSPPRGG